MKEWEIINSLVPIVLSNIKGCIVEIGLGNSTTILNTYAKQFNRKHYACDKKKRVCDWIKNNIGNNINLYNCLSFDFIKQFKDCPAIIFIDGNHSYSVVKQEVDFFLPKLVCGGIMFLHDTYICKRWYKRYLKIGKESDTYKIRQDLEKNSDVYTMTFPYTAAWCGLTVVLKKDLNRPYYQQ